MGVYLEGKYELVGKRDGIRANLTLGATAAETPIITLRNKEVYQSKTNRVPVKLLFLAASAEHSKPVEVALYRNATLTGASFSDLDTNTSVLEADTTATAFTGGTFLFSIPLGKTGQQILDFTSDKFGEVYLPGEAITATIKPSSGNGAEATVSYNLIELM